MAAAAPYFEDCADAPPGGRGLWTEAGDGVRLRVVLWPGPSAARGTVLFFPGRTEYAEKYGPAAGDLARRGYAMASIDWRGQGLADRRLSNRLTGDVARFSDYQRDVAAVVELLRAEAMPEPWFLIGHSMGGAIGLRAIHNGLAVRAAVFSGPMWGIYISPTLRPIAGSVSQFATRFGQGHRYAPSTRSVPYVLAAPFAGNLLTSDADMYDFMRRQITRHPDLSLGGPSLRWLSEALSECAALRRLPPPDLPAYCVLGSGERIVDVPAVRAIMARWPKGRLEIYEGARHEIPMEGPEIRRRFYDTAAALFAAA